MHKTVQSRNRSIQVLQGNLVLFEMLVSISQVSNTVRKFVISYKQFCVVLEVQPILGSYL